MSSLAPAFSSTCVGWLCGEERAGREKGERRREKRERRENGKRREKTEGRKERGREREKERGSGEGLGGKAYTQLGEYTVGCQKDIYIPYRY